MIDEYLSRLRTELSGADPAVVNDAVYDADEYLRAELVNVAPEDQEAAMARIYETYGTPAEVASAYLSAEQMTAPLSRKAPTVAPSSKGILMSFLGIVSDPRAWGSLMYMLLSLATGVIYFTIVVTGFSLSVGMAILIIGIPIMLLFLGVVRAVSLVEGRLIEALLGERMPRRPALSPSEGGIFKRIKWWLLDYRTWTTMVYMVLMLPLGIIYFSTIVIALSLVFALFVGPLVQFATGIPMVITGDYGYYIEWYAVPFMWAAGALVFILTLHLAKLVGRIHGAYAKVMLVGRFTDSDQAPE